MDETMNKKTMENTDAWFKESMEALDKVIQSAEEIIEKHRGEKHDTVG